MKQKPEPYAELFHYNDPNPKLSSGNLDDNDDGPERVNEINDRDPDQEENFIETYVDKFAEDATVHEYYSDEGLFKDSDWSLLLKNLQDQAQREGDPSKAPIHRSLICSNNFKMGEWMIELRKSFQPAEVFEGEEGKGILMLELHSFSPSRPSESLGSFEIGRFGGSEIEHLFNNNLECLFNHMLVNNELFFYSVEEVEDTE